MDRKDFKKLFSEILDELPEDFSKKIVNVAFIVEEEPSRELKSSEDLDENTLLLGFYEGVPYVSRLSTSYAGVPPDRILIFQKNIETVAGKKPEKIRAVLKRTLLHEIAHYFGISDKRLQEIGAY